MNETLIRKKQKIAESLKTSLKLIESDIEKLKSKKEKKAKVKTNLSTRNLQFSRDDARTLVSKFKNKKYSDYKPEILKAIKKKYENVSQRKVKTETSDKTNNIYKNFFQENEK